MGNVNSIRHYETEEITLNLSEHVLFEIVHSKISASVISLGDKQSF